jgi:hypothetical protein
MAATPSTTITLGGEKRALRFTNRALVAIEDETGKTMAEIGTRATLGSFRAISVMLWAALLHEQPKLTVDQVIDMIELPELENIAGSLNTALEAALGKPAKETKGGKAVAA